MVNGIKLISLLEEYKKKADNKFEFLKLIREAEIIEEVFHSNAIENSTLTLDETERILLDMEVEKIRSIREAYEAKNLYRVYNYIEDKNPEINLDTILLCHKFLLDNISEGIAGRIRIGNENVRVGNHIAPEPEFMSPLLDELLLRKIKKIEDVVKFHVDFERLHPFIDGNGRIGRVIVNWQLKQLKLPPIIVRSESKITNYYPFLSKTDYNGLTKIWNLLLSESLNKRLAYLSGRKIITLSEYAKTNTKNSLSSLINKANRQTIPAFRIRGVWNIAE